MKKVFLCVLFLGTIGPISVMADGFGHYITCKTTDGLSAYSIFLNGSGPKSAVVVVSPSLQSHSGSAAYTADSSYDPAKGLSLSMQSSGGEKYSLELDVTRTKATFTGLAGSLTCDNTGN
jgi:hypothetical protein